MFAGEDAVSPRETFTPQCSQDSRASAITLIDFNIVSRFSSLRFHVFRRFFPLSAKTLTYSFLQSTIYTPGVSVPAYSFHSISVINIFIKESDSGNFQHQHSGEEDLYQPTRTDERAVVNLALNYVRINGFRFCLLFLIVIWVVAKEQTR